jgi:hypothetical protein
MPGECSEECSEQRGKPQGGRRMANAFATVFSLTRFLRGWYSYDEGTARMIRREFPPTPLSLIPACRIFPTGDRRSALRPNGLLRTRCLSPSNRLARRTAKKSGAAPDVAECRIADLRESCCRRQSPKPDRSQRRLLVELLVASRADTRGGGVVEGRRPTVRSWQ